MHSWCRRSISSWRREQRPNFGVKSMRVAVRHKGDSRLSTLLTGHFTLNTMLTQQDATDENSSRSSMSAFLSQEESARTGQASLCLPRGMKIVAPSPSGSVVLCEIVILRPVS